jgi:protocatechuate 3,4-dioxygenase beta subunit
MFDALRKHRDRRSPPPRRPPLRIEPLEDRTALSAISGFVYHDLNHNGVFDAGDVGIGGNTVQLYNSSTQLIATVVTDANGYYQFSVDQTVTPTAASKEVDAVFADAPTNSTRTQTVTQFDPSLGTLTGVEIVDDSTLTSVVSVESLDAAGQQIKVQLNGNTTLSGGGLSGLQVAVSGGQQANLGPFDGTIDFAGSSGQQFAPQQMTGTNSTMITDPAALASWVGNGTVTLALNATATSDTTGSGNVAAMVHTSAAAQVKVIYHYTTGNALKPGSYIVVQPQNPPGFFDGKNTTSDGTVIPPWNGTIEYLPVTVSTPTSVSANNDFGELKPGSLSGYAYFDANGDGWLEPGEPGLPNVTITLTGTDAHGNAVNQTTQTDANGLYTFSNLVPGTYTLTKTTTPAGFLDYVDRAGNLGGAAGHDVISQINLGSDQAGVNYDFGHVQPASVSGFVYVDANRDGAFDGGDAGLGNVTLTLQGTNFLGQTVQLSTTTDATGFYSFGGLLPGFYAVTKTPPAGFLDGATNLGNLGGTAIGDTYWLTLTQGAAGTQYNFGELLPANNTPFTPSQTPGNGAPPPQQPQTPSNDIPSKTPFFSDSWKWHWQ